MIIKVINGNDNVSQLRTGMAINDNVSRNTEPLTNTLQSLSISTKKVSSALHLFSKLIRLF